MPLAMAPLPRSSCQHLGVHDWLATLAEVLIGMPPQLHPQPHSLLCQAYFARCHLQQQGVITQMPSRPGVRRGNDAQLG